VSRPAVTLADLVRVAGMIGSGNAARVYGR